jgi:hypothetical protein
MRSISALLDSLNSLPAHTGQSDASAGSATAPSQLLLCGDCVVQRDSVRHVRLATPLCLREDGPQSDRA